MKSYFTSEFFANNRRHLKDLCSDNALIVLAGNGLLQRGADSAYAFAQDANFWYLTGIDEPDLMLVMQGDDEYIIVPERDGVRQAFDGAVQTSALSVRSGVSSILTADKGWERLESQIKKFKKVATLPAPPAYIDHFGMYTNPSRAQLIDRLKTVHGRLKIVDIGIQLRGMRMIKQAPELRAIQQAIDITIKGIKNVSSTAKLQKFNYEYEIEAELTRSFRGQGAHGHAFDPIVASGKDSCTLHSISNNARLNKGTTLVLDVGAEVEHYAADLTRTKIIGNPSKRQREVHAAVVEIQDYAMSLLKPGVLIKEYEQLIETCMGQKLKELGLINRVSHKAIRKFYPHATSHFLGLNVHDAGIYDAPLEEGTVLTVEPGIYIPDEGIGVRIEDDILITKDGIKVLSQKLSRELQ